ncbi:MAG: trimethylamine methyltransferase family protein [Deltaproteobacteria bacterium]|jgi:trimethylamine--corrinoid protein Co-methyltransferase|nr:trimethylamine methyltransferase family protein [Deltaproteobacteria bacterium]
MDPNVKRFNSTPLEYLSEEQMRDIHSAALDILEDGGTMIHHEKSIELLRRAGAHVKDDRHVFMPSGLVESAIRSAPSRVTIYNRNGKPSMFLEGRNVYYGTGSDCPYLLDSFTGERREFLAGDLEESVRLVDALPNIDFTMSNGLAPDIPNELQYQYKYALMIRNSTKPQVITAADRTSLNDIADIAAAAVGGRKELSRKPIFVLYDEPTSPLVHISEAMEKLMFMAEHNLPTNYSPGIMAGGTSPVTMAGAIAQADAEILAGLVIHQLKNAGAPFIFGAGMSPMDMQSMQPTYSAPEAMMTQAGLCQIGRCLYQLPTWGFGGCSASKLADEQAVNEAATYIMMAGWAGTNLVHDVGYLEFGLTYSFDLLVMCDEFIGQVRRMMEGIPVDRENLAVESIKRVGPGGHFLSDNHTLDHFRENWQPDLTDRRTYEDWKSRGAKSMGRLAKEKVKKIKESHQPEPLAPEVDAEIETILERAKRRSAG